MSATKESYIRHRIERARETLEEARVLAKEGLWHGVVNRLYYACFYAVSALLYTEGLSSSKHSGVRSLFNQHFVKTGIVSVEKARFYSDLFENRQESDYEDLGEVDRAQAAQWIEEAGNFVEGLVALVAERME